MEIIKQIQKMEDAINEMLKDKKILVRIIGNDDKNKGTIILSKDNKINRTFDIEVISSFQINISENGKIIQRGWFIEKIGAWLFNLFNSVEYLYVFHGGKLNRKILTKKQIEKLSTENTIDFSEERKKGLPVHSKDLDNQPIVEGYLGPMFEDVDYGKVYLRYETQKGYNMQCK